MISASSAFLLLILVGLLGLALGYLLRFLQMTVAKAQLEVNVKKNLLKAREQAADIIAKANTQTLDLRTELEAKRQQLRHDKLALDENKAELQEQVKKNASRKTELDDLVSNYKKSLNDIANSNPNLDLSDLRQQMTDLVDLQLESHYQTKKSALEISLDDDLNNIIQQVLPQVARRTVRNNTSVTINVSGSEIGKIIGKDGVNIKSFERYAGVDLVIDDVANTVTVSSLSPKRRLIAKQALIELLEDGRINRDQIYHSVREVEDRLLAEATKLVNRGLRDLNLDTNPIITKNPEIKSHLVNLYFRHSYGQNQLEHSLEVADIAGRIAAEILPDQVAGAKLVGLLHDLGKASIGSTNHVDESIKLLQQYSEVPKPILNAIAEHHDTKPGSVLSAILQAADAISSGRPGARNPRSDQALIRQEKLEELISEYHDVDNVFALSGGREVHILIRNRNYSQSNMRQLLTNITKKIQDENLAYSPITITMIREDEIVQNLA